MSDTRGEYIHSFREFCFVVGCVPYIKHIIETWSNRETWKVRQKGRTLKIEGKVKPIKLGPAGWISARLESRRDLLRCFVMSKYLERLGTVFYVSKLKSSRPELSRFPAVPRPPPLPMTMPEKYVGPALAVVATVVALAVIRRQLTSRRTTPYPPGPKGYPVIGNVFDFPKDPIWEGFAKMAQEHGERVLSRLVLVCC